MLIAAILISSVYAAVRVSNDSAWILDNTSRYVYSDHFLNYNTDLTFLLYVNYKIQNCGTISAPPNSLTCDSIPIRNGEEFAIVSNFVIRCIVNTSNQFSCGIPHVYPCQDLGPEIPQIVIAPDVRSVVGGMIGLYLFLFSVFFFKYA